MGSANVVLGLRPASGFITEGVLGMLFDDHVNIFPLQTECEDSRQHEVYLTERTSHDVRLEGIQRGLGYFRAEFFECRACNKLIDKHALVLVRIGVLGALLEHKLSFRIKIRCSFAISI